MILPAGCNTLDGQVRLWNSSHGLVNPSAMAINSFHPHINCGANQHYAMQGPSGLTKTMSMRPNRSK